MLTARRVQEQVEQKSLVRLGFRVTILYVLEVVGELLDVFVVLRHQYFEIDLQLFYIEIILIR